MPDNCTMKSKSDSCSPKERCHTKEMSAVALSVTEESFRWITAYTKRTILLDLVEYNKVSLWMDHCIYKKPSKQIQNSIRRRINVTAFLTSIPNNAKKAAKHVLHKEQKRKNEHML